MANQHLVDYIQESISAGYTQGMLEQALAQRGWDTESIQQAFSAASARSEASSASAAAAVGGAVPIVPASASPRPSRDPPQGKRLPRGPRAETGQKPGYQQMGVLEKFRMVITSPGHFFQAVKPEQGYEPPVKYFLFLLFVQLIVVNAIVYVSLAIGYAIFDPSMVNPLMTLFTVETISSLLFANLVIALGIFLIFVFSWMMDRFMQVVGGHGGLENTFKGIIYAYSPYVLLIIISLPISYLALYPGMMLISDAILYALEAIFILWCGYLVLRGLSVLHGVGMINAFAALVMAGAVVAVIGGIMLVSLAILLPSIFPPVSSSILTFIL